MEIELVDVVESARSVVRCVANLSVEYIMVL